MTTSIATLLGRRPAGTGALTIEIDTTDAPNLVDWAQGVKRRAYSWWPIIITALASPGYAPPDKVVVKFSNVGCGR